MNNPEPRWKERLHVFNNALARLKEVADLSRHHKLTDIESDSLIKRFEFTYEMAWKLLMSYEKDNGETQMFGSKDVVRRAVQMSLIDNPEPWMDMIDARNRTSHVYDSEMATDIADEIISTYCPLFDELLAKMSTLQ